MNTLAVESSQDIYYSNAPEHNPTPLEIADLIRSLDYLSTHLRPILKDIYPEISLEHIEVRISSLSTGSLDIQWVTKFLFGNEKNMLTAMRQHAERSPVLKKLLSSNKAVAWLFLALTLGSAVWKLWPDSPSQTSETAANPSSNIIVGGDFIHISGQYNTAISRAADEFGVDRQAVDMAVREVVKQQKVRDAAAKVIDPARRDPNAHITFNHDSEVRVRPETIGEYPQVLQAEPPTRTVVKKRVEVEIRATDLDNSKRWAAIVRSVWSGRRPMRVRIENPGRLAGVQRFVGDVLVEEIKNENGEWLPERYELIALEHLKEPSAQSPPADDAAA